MSDTEIVITRAIAAAALLYAAFVHWRLGGRLARIERSRAVGSEDCLRIWRSVNFTEDRQRAEMALMAAVGSAEPVQLYRREGRRFVPHGDPS
ncbi:hypothetical protein [Sphingomonas bacterium]|uniref:hypothetical protein n=1 Tax=Sphingomonas bacterium TaxID=1895847 RepID=UPI0015759B3F|nr:hypothetical protein [Sphingomonas bacterium]